MFRIILLTAALTTVPTIQEPTITYTSDSVIQEGVSLVLNEEKSTEYQVHIDVIVDLPLGYVIYDDPESPTVEGLKVGNECINDDYVIECSPDLLQGDWTVYVKTVYDKGLAGIIASMQDGTYDYSQLLTNPLMIIQGIYYIIAAISIIVGGIGVFKSKKYKATTSEQWKNTANEFLDKAITITKEQTLAAALNFFNADVLPLIKQCLSNDQKIVQAIAVQTSKDDKAPLTVLDILQEVSNNVDTVKIINQAKELIEKSKQEKEQALEETKQALAEIASSTTSKDDTEGRY